MVDVIQAAVRDWYLLLSQVSAALSAPVKQLAETSQVSIVGVLLMGFVGALSPCQMTTNLSAITYVSRRAGEGQPWREALAYTLAKVLIYMTAGGAMIFLGLALQQAAIPVVIVTRKIVGPLMILVGLGLLGFMRLRGSFGRRISDWLEARLPNRDLIGAFSLGIVFSFTFCPTLLWLFFGIMIPLAAVSAGGWIFPGVFALGTVLPVLVIVGLMVHERSLSSKLATVGSRYHRRITQVSGTVFILAGLNDTLIYWLI